ncbi:hypothetical protein NQ314_014272 [Rhamnusium bicolor]|uniref:RDD domain-containing protein n=1 Tax=Rhamnusium bicolor TaxID=1586634 RepID=A0AAV8X327_9CUCU|nr:hypothetical protein NQ314_014272 [Rhamnusium bicolor]
MERTQPQRENEQNGGEIEEETWAKRKCEREEYLEKLKKWLDDARLWHYNICCGFPNSNESNSDNSLQQQQQQISNIYATLAQVNLWNENLQNAMRQRFPNIDVAANRNISSPLYQTSTQVTQPNQPPSTYEFIIPPIWKRIVAELMDFLILFLVKMALTFLLLESFDIIDMEFYGFESFQKNLENHEIGMPMAIELLTLELLHRLIVCAYEAYFLKGKLCATPGKTVYGINGDNSGEHISSSR